MRFGKFLLSEIVPLLAVLLITAAWSIFAVAADVNRLFILLSVCIVAVSSAVFFTVKFIVVNKRIRKLNRIADELDEGYLLGETLPEPYGATEREYFFVMKRISHSAIARIEELRRSGEEYSDYIEKWIHEIKTPLTSCALIIANGGDRAKLMAEFKKADNLAESVLYHARLRSMEKDTALTRESVRKTADNAVKSQAELLVAAGISVNIDGDAMISTDHKSLAFSIKQLLVNCAKYCRGCKIQIEISDRCLTLTDDGRGIPSHELPCIFNRSFVGSAGRKAGGGTGMGLYLVKETCERLGIEVSAQSEPDRFTRFIFKFP